LLFSCSKNYSNGTVCFNRGNGLRCNSHHFAAALVVIRQQASATIEAMTNADFSGNIFDFMKYGATPWSWQVCPFMLKSSLYLSVSHAVFKQVLTRTRASSVCQWLHVRTGVACTNSCKIAKHVAQHTFQELRERVFRVKEWITAALSSGRGLVSVNLETLGCAFAGCGRATKCFCDLLC
jgi:hypothetical protein